MATEFREQYQLGKELHETLNFQVEAVHRLHDDENIYDKPLSGFAAGIKKVQKVIQDQRQHLKFQHAASKARRLPTYDRRRIAFIANSIDSFSNKFFGLPHYQVDFLRDEFLVAVPIHLGVPVPILRPYVGQPIQNNFNLNYSVDPYAYQLTTVTCIEGGGTNRNHNKLVQVVYETVKESGIRCVAAGCGTGSPKQIFNRAIPTQLPQYSADDKRCLDSIIPDMVIYASDLNDEGRDLIVDMKTLSPSASYEHNKSEFAYAVRGRQDLVNREYYAAAARMDERHHATPAGVRGPYTEVLKNFGDDGRVLGAVTGFFGEVSADVEKIAELAARQLAKKHAEFYRCTEKHAKALSLEKIRRRWDHTMKKSWARLVLDRLNSYVKIGGGEGGSGEGSSGVWEVGED